MRWDVFAWAAVALLLFAAEALAPGAFMLWLGLAAAVVFVVVLLFSGIPVLAQVAAFVVLSFVSIQVYRRWFRHRETPSDQPALNRRTAALVGRVVQNDHLGRTPAQQDHAGIGAPIDTSQACGRDIQVIRPLLIYLHPVIARRPPGALGGPQRRQRGPVHRNLPEVAEWPTFARVVQWQRHRMDSLGQHVGERA